MGQPSGGLLSRLWVQQKNTVFSIQHFLYACTAMKGFLTKLKKRTWIKNEAWKVPGKGGITQKNYGSQV